MIENKEYNWWNIRHYCYICGVIGRIPGPGYWLVAKHLDRLKND